MKPHSITRRAGQIIIFRYKRANLTALNFTQEK